MRSIEELLQLNQIPNPRIQDSTDDVISDEIQNSENNTEEQYPEYLFIDPEMSGFSDTNIQNTIYNIATYGTLPLTGDVSILDIGAGRGDFYDYVKNTYPQLNISFTGYELNPVLVNVGNLKHENADDFELILDNFLNIDSGKKYDYSFVIGSLNINYGWNDNWVQIENIIKKAIDVTTKNVTMILLHDTGGDDAYISYPIPNLTDLLLKFNVPFSIDYGEIYGIYKLTIKPITFNN